MKKFLMLFVAFFSTLPCLQAEPVQDTMKIPVELYDHMRSQLDQMQKENDVLNDVVYVFAAEQAAFGDEKSALEQEYKKVVEEKSVVVRELESIKGQCANAIVELQKRTRFCNGASIGLFAQLMLNVYLGLFR